MALNENIVIKLMADTSNYNTKMQAASVQAEKLSTSMEKPRSTTDKLKSGFMTAGLAVGALSAAIGVAAVKSFMDFDASMSVVQSNTHATGSELQSLRDAALDAGQRTVYSATESADAINELAKAGMSTTDILNGGLNGALDLAASDGMAVSDAAELMASTLAQFNLTGKDSTKVADALAAGAGKAQGSASDLGMALSQAGLVANQYGISMQETTGTLAAFANAGMIGSDAGTSLKTMLLKLASPTDKAQSTLDELGISAYDAQGNFVGLSGLAGQLKDKMSGLSMEQRNAALQTIFGTDAIRGANVLYNEGAAGIDKWTKGVSDSGFAAEQGAARMDNLKGDIEQFGGAVETSFIRIGEGANGPLRSVVQGVTDVISAFGSLDPKIQQSVVMVGLGVGAFAGLHKVFGELSTSSSAFGQGMGLALDPVQRLSAAWPQLREGAGQLASAFTGAGTGVESLSGAAGRGGKALSGLRSIGSGVVNLLGGAWGIAMLGAGLALNSWADHVKLSKAATDAFKEALEDTGSASSTVVKMIKTGENIDWGWWQKGQTGASSYADLLDQVGVSYSTVAAAAAHDKTAIEEYNKAFLQLGTGDLDVKKQQQAAATLDQLTKARDKAKKELAAEKEAQQADTKEKVNNTLATAGLTDATSDNASATSDAADASEILAEQLGASSKGASNQAAALGEAVSALKTYYGFAQSVFDADTKLGKAILDANDAIKENGKTLDTNTEKGNANRDALSNVASAVKDSAEAYARQTGDVNKVNEVMNKGRDQVIKLAESMGWSKDQATAWADSIGLTKEGVNQLVDSIKQANATPIAITDNASKTLDAIQLKAQGLADGTTVRISGDNKPFLQTVAQVTGTTIDPKTGELDLDKDQYDMALALANGAKIDPKTGQLLGDNTDAWKKFAETQGWTIDPKTGVISGDNGPYKATKAVVDMMTIAEKKGLITAKDDATSIIQKVQRLSVADKYFTIHGSYVDDSGGTYTSTGYRPKGATGTIPFATGGYVSGPGTGTSDSIFARISNGEYIMTAATVKALGVGFLDSLNYRQYATGGLVQQYQAGVVPNKADGGGSRSSVGPMINLTYVDQVAGLGAEARLTQAAARAKSILADVL